MGAHGRDAARRDAVPNRIRCVDSLPPRLDRYIGRTVSAAPTAAHRGAPVRRVPPRARVRPDHFPDRGRPDLAVAALRPRRLRLLRPQRAPVRSRDVCGSHRSQAAPPGAVRAVAHPRCHPLRVWPESPPRRNPCRGTRLHPADNCEPGRVEAVSCGHKRPVVGRSQSRRGVEAARRRVVATTVRTRGGVRGAVASVDRRGVCVRCMVVASAHETACANRRVTLDHRCVACRSSVWRVGVRSGAAPRAVTRCRRPAGEYSEPPGAILAGIRIPNECQRGVTGDDAEQCLLRVVRLVRAVRVAVCVGAAKTSLPGSLP